MSDRPKRSKESDAVLRKEPVDFLNTGSTNLNLAASQKAENGGWARGRIVNIVGDGSSGKSLSAIEACAQSFWYMKGNESHNFPRVEEVKVVYNNVEGVMDFPLDLMYGEEFEKGIVWIRTGTVQAFGRDLFSRLDSLEPGQHLLYVVDSWDALDSEEEAQAFAKSIKSDKPMEGSYDLGKQKYGSKRFFKYLCSEIEGEDGGAKKDCTLIIISQVRLNIGVTFGAKKTRVGGDALNFYTHQVCWLREAKKLTHTSQGETLVTGISVEAKFKRNKVALPFREARFDITLNRGIDDITSMVKWVWGPESKTVDFDEKKFKNYPSLVKYIEDNSLEQTLIGMTKEKWNKIEKAVKVERKPRFPTQT